MKKHMDDHFNFAKSIKMSATTEFSRQFAKNPNDWTHMDESHIEIKIPEGGVGGKNQPVVASSGVSGAQGSSGPSLVPLTKSGDTQCNFCGEEFETELNKEENVWYLRNAKKVKIEPYKENKGKDIYELKLHVECFGYLQDKMRETLHEYKEIAQSSPDEDPDKEQVSQDEEQH